MRLLIPALLVLCSSFMVSCPRVVISSITGTWRAVGVVRIPFELRGTLDSFEVTLLPDGSGELVPGSGIDVGLDPEDIEILDGPNIDYSFDGSRATIIISIRFILLDDEYSANHIFDLRAISERELRGTRIVNLRQDGVLVAILEYDERWTLVDSGGIKYEPPGDMSGETPNDLTYFALGHLLQN